MMTIECVAAFVCVLGHRYGYEYGGTGEADSERDSSPKSVVDLADQITSDLLYFAQQRRVGTGTPTHSNYY